MRKSPRYCECGEKIVIRQRGRGVVPAKKDHELCRHCDSSLLRAASQAINKFSRQFWPPSIGQLATA